MTMSKRSSRASDIEPRFEPIGTRDIISTPPEMTRSSWPDHTAAAALKFVCIDEPHCRSTVVAAHRDGPAGGERDVAADVPGLLVDLRHAAPLEILDLGRDRRRFARRAPFTTWAESSSPRMCESVPFFLPIGLRTASTISASVTGHGHGHIVSPRSGRC